MEALLDGKAGKPHELAGPTPLATPKPNCTASATNDAAAAAPSGGRADAGIPNDGVVRGVPAMDATEGAKATPPPRAGPVGVGSESSVCESRPAGTRGTSSYPSTAPCVPYRHPDVVHCGSHARGEDDEDDEDDVDDDDEDEEGRVPGRSPVEDGSGGGATAATRAWVAGHSA